MRPGDVIAGRFEVERLAGAGGMGVVYRARDRRSGSPVAVKLLQPGRGEAGRFEREARVLAELDHPAIVRWVAHGTTEAGELFLAMEWLEGEDLEARLEREPLTLAESLEVARRVAGALGAAHARGLVHRDVKPSNVLLVGGDVGRAMLLDFGIALRGGGRSVSRMTRTGLVVGTPGYLAPEQARGERDLDARADVFSLGCLLFECVAGRPAFEAEQVLALLAKILFEEPPRLTAVRPDVPVALDALVARMLAKEPAARPRDGAELELLLGGLVLGESSGRRSIPTVSRPEMTTGEQRLVGVVFAARAATETATGPTTIADPPGTADTMLQGTPAPTDPAVSTVGRFELLRRAVARHGASLEPLAGGAFVAMVGGGGTASDDAVQAARAALALSVLLPEATVGLVTGRAVVGETLPLGPALEAAARLVEGHGTGVAIDAATAALLGARFEVVPAGDGWELRGERDDPEPVRTLMGKATRCFGRRKELALCEGTFDECVSEPAARALVVTAPAGVGKSRLRHELLRTLRARGEPLEVWVGRGDPTNAGSAFGMIAPALRRAAGVLDGSPIEEQRARITERFGRHLGPEQRPRVLPLVGELAAVSWAEPASGHARTVQTDPIVLGDQMMVAWLDLLEAETRAHAVLLVLEDLHWGDYPSVRFVDAALREHRERPLMVLALGRPEVEELFPKLWRERGAIELRLEGIGKRAGEQLVRSILGESVSDQAVARVVEHAAGNAFYLEELTRALAEGRAELPESVRAMVEARLLALAPETRRALRAASVLGERSWQGAVRALAGDAVQTGDVDARLAEACEAGLLEARPTARFAGEREYLFQHAIVREVAYGMLLPEDRVLGHRLAAAWLEAQGEHDAVAVAEHFQKGGLPARAREHYLRAAREALSGNDFRASVDLAERGLACAGDDALASALWLVQAEALVWRGEFAGARDAGERALAALPEGSGSWFEAAGRVVSGCLALGDSARAAELVDRAVALSGRGDDPAITTITLARMARVLLLSGALARGHEALSAMEQTRARAVPPDLPRVSAFVHRAYGTRAVVSGDPVMVLEHEQAATASFELDGDLRQACNSRSSAAYAWGGLGRYAEAEAALRSALAEAERLGLVHLVTTNQHNLGLVLARQGKLAEARRYESAALDAFVTQGNRWLVPAARLYLAEILFLAGALAEAERVARTAAEPEAPRPSRTMALAQLSRVLCARGKPAEGRTASAEASALLAELGALEEGEPLVRLMEAETLAAVGDTGAAHSAIRLARDKLLERAARITRDDLRRSFLEVPDHARTLALAREWIRESP